jgi:hypothetical protein
MLAAHRALYKAAADGDLAAFQAQVAEVQRLFLITYIQATLKYAELMDKAVAAKDQETLQADQVGFSRIYAVCKTLMICCTSLLRGVRCDRQHSGCQCAHVPLKGHMHRSIVDCRSSRSLLYSWHSLSWSFLLLLPLLPLLHRPNATCLSAASSPSSLVSSRQLIPAAFASVAFAAAAAAKTLAG